MTSNDSLGIANEIINKFIPSLGTDRTACLGFFGDDSSLFFHGDQLENKDQISEFLEQLPSSVFLVEGYEVQSVPNTQLWTMMVVFGKAVIGDTGAKFFSTIYVEAIPTEKIAKIVYMTMDFN